MLKFACVKYTSLTTPADGKQFNFYTYEDVNALYAMVKANCTETFEFYCFTEDSANLHADINVVALNSSLNLDRVWWKMEIFNKAKWDAGDTVFYMDLDIAIQRNFDSMCGAVTSTKLKTCLIGDHWQSVLNSSLMAFNGHEMDHLYTDFVTNKTSVLAAYTGIDPYLTARWGSNWVEGFNYPGDYYDRTKLHLNDEDADLLDSDGSGNPLYYYNITFTDATEDGARTGDRIRVYWKPLAKIVVLSGCYAKMPDLQNDLAVKLATL
jgi:hypothetical protein